ncbi:Surfactin synthase thioesterase subunit [Streptomyces sp. cf386]|uniref:thioesterase II family protein n=1 Tax=Streptomyces sp. cf386 TaxID=1761904 RepID=UPI00088F1601|nr:thioesterase domain-containing protein [Streptomyces sp. cf386]SDP00715.1 Surfactin synthase thioesterase subunit [Streptomyces sp. cf386]
MTGEAARDHEPVPVYCFAHAGAGVSAFHRWRQRPDPAMGLRPVLLPGREKRRDEPRLTERPALIADLLRSLGPLPVPPRPYILYGHSLGGLVAYSLARALADAGLPAPALVAVGACPPPDAVTPLADSAEASDTELVAMLSSFGAVPPGARPGGTWYRAVLPVLRDDLRLARALRGAATRPLGVPLLAVAGRRDPIAGPGVMAGWREWTTDAFVERVLPGDHFFLRDRELPRLLGRACRTLTRFAGRTAPVPVPIPQDRPAHGAPRGPHHTGTSRRSPMPMGTATRDSR